LANNSFEQYRQQRFLFLLLNQDTLFNIRIWLTTLDSSSIKQVIQMTMRRAVLVVAAAVLVGCTVTSALQVGGVSPKFDFDRLSQLNQRLSTLEELAPEYILNFYEPQYRGFSVKPGVYSKLGVTSSCYAILALLAGRASGVYDATIQWSGTSSLLGETPNKVSLQNTLQAILESEWRHDDLFQVSVLLYALLKAKTSDDQLLVSIHDSSHAAIQKCLSIVLQARPQRRMGVQQLFSSYILYQCTSVYGLVSDLLHGGDVSTLDMLTTNATSLQNEVSVALDRSAETACSELCRQLAFRAAHDSTSFDPIKLAYSILSYMKATERLASKPNNHSNKNYQALNQKLITAGLNAFFEEQNDNGLWDKGQPIYKSFRRQGRNVGNAFVFVVDTVASLLDSIPAESFRPHLAKLEKLLVWFETHEGVETISFEEQGITKTIRGWSSNHLSSDEAGPAGWSTAQVVRCISLMKQTIRQLQHNDVLREFKGIALSQKGPRPADWNQLLDSDLGGLEETRTIKEILDNRVCIPFSNSINNPTMGAAYSSILFGPPGTAKTTICESLAKRMGWDFVVIDTAAFLADGLTNVSARIRYVFERLQALHECVILFDEIEEFCLDRETPGLSMESRMLTTAMLTAINDLRRTKESVFFMATNRLRAFDSAITRPGRFDMQLFVATPNLLSRVELLKQALASVVISEEVKEDSLQIYNEHLESIWTLEDNVIYFNFLESRQIASAIAIYHNIS